MTLSDNQFREAFKPLHIPADFDISDTKENKVIYAFAQLGSGTAGDVSRMLSELQPDLIDDATMITPEHILKGLFDRGLLRGREENGDIIYDLSKITTPNKGEVDPDLLASGLD